jgi:hypothetical protein
LSWAEGEPVIGRQGKMAGPVDSFLKVSIAAATLFASASVGYYYVFYLPQRDTQLERERRLDAARTEFARQAEQERQSTACEAVQVQYRNCVREIELNYSSQWNGECKRIMDKATKDHRDCLAKRYQKDVCDVVHSERNSPSSDCSLPRMLANDINETLEKGSCLDESQAGLQ